MVKIYKMKWNGLENRFQVRNLFQFKKDVYSLLGSVLDVGLQYFVYLIFRFFFRVCLYSEFFLACKFLIIYILFSEDVGQNWRNIKI